MLENLVSACRVNNSAGVKSVIFLHPSDLNVRYAGNKAMAIKSFTVDNDIDVLALTETWFHDDNYNVVNMSTLSATGYRFLHNARAVWRGWGC